MRIATLLMGKHKPQGIFSQANDQAGDYVVVTNAEAVRVTGKKAEQKLYYRHSMYPGGLKTETFNQRLSTKPDAVSPTSRIESTQKKALLAEPSLPMGRLRYRSFETLSLVCCQRTSCGTAG